MKKKSIHFKEERRGMSLSVQQGSTHLRLFLYSQWNGNSANTENIFLQKSVETLWEGKKYVTCANKYLSMFEWLDLGCWQRNLARIRQKSCLFCNFLFCSVPLLILWTSTWFWCALMKLVLALPGILWNEQEACPTSQRAFHSGFPPGVSSGKMIKAGALLVYLISWVSRYWASHPPLFFACSSIWLSYLKTAMA